MAGDMDLARTINLDGFRAYSWLVTIADPDPRMYSCLRSAGVDLDHCINLLGGAIALCEWSIAGPKENCIVLPVMDEDWVTPVDVVMFSMANPARFATMLGLGAVLGAGEVMNPATYWGGQPCRLVRTPLEWLRERIEGCAVVLDPPHAKRILRWAPGDFAAVDVNHADHLVAMGAVDPERLFVARRRAA
jgi:hypothetical protein